MEQKGEGGVRGGRNGGSGGAHMILSATGSRKAPNAVARPSCGEGRRDTEPSAMRWMNEGCKRTGAHPRSPFAPGSRPASQ